MFIYKRGKRKHESFVNKHESLIKRGINTYSITIDYIIVCKVVCTMFDYLEGAIIECAEDLKNSRSYYPGNDQLFKVVEDSVKLPPKDTELFDWHVERLLFANKRIRPNIKEYVAFLYSQVKSPTKQDYRKLGKVISCLKENIHLLLVIAVDNDGTLTWNIDAPFAVHLDCKVYMFE